LLKSGRCNQAGKISEILPWKNVSQEQAQILFNRVKEATAAQSRKDFVSKMSIASKEARETNYWLRLLRDSKLCKDTDFSHLIKESEEIIKIITAIVKTTQRVD